jgi:D-alanyl-D-alanine-carboxypeptidase/D-alanyl-D-alanine-endopeptidase
MRLVAIATFAFTVAATQADVIRSHFSPAAGTPERPAASVAWIVDGKTAFAQFGHKTLPDGPAPAADTAYEIGSITKTFTATLLADMILNKEITLETTIGDLVPGAKDYPADVRRITVGKIATHSSGLPRLPANLFATVKDPANPYATYTPEHLDAFLRTFVLPAAPKPEYSNLGFGLLGYALATKAGKSYEQLITERVLAPLGMRDSGITLTGSQQSRLAPGHADGKAVANWDIPTLAGAGALRSTPADMAKYLSAVLDPPDSRIGRAIRMARDPRADFANGMRIGLAWIAAKSDGGKDLIWHNGGTGGYRSFIGIIPDSKVGLVVLTNANSNPDPIAMKALNALVKR